MKTAVPYSERSVTIATLMPNFFGSIGIEIAAWVSTLLSDSRSDMMTGSNDSRSRSCRYGVAFGGRFDVVVKVASSPAAATHRRKRLSGWTCPPSAQWATSGS
jgi:hypothetical protein